MKHEIMVAAHQSVYTVHPGSTKMYQDLRQHYWWSRMKADVADFVARCLTCQQVKTEHQRPGGESSASHDSRVEMGEDYHGFCGWFTPDSRGT